MSALAYVTRTLERVLFFRDWHGRRVINQHLEQVHGELLSFKRLRSRVLHDHFKTGLQLSSLQLLVQVSLGVDREQLTLLVFERLLILIPI